MKPRLIKGTFSISGSEFRANLDTQFQGANQREKHSVRVVRNEVDTGWDITCTCEPGTHPGDPVVIGTVPDAGMIWRRSLWVAYAEAWDHVAHEIQFAIDHD